MRFEVPGKPKGKGRHRTLRTGRSYTPKDTLNAESEVIRAWQEAGAERLPDDVAIYLYVHVMVERPQAHLKKDGSLSAEGRRHPWPRNKKPDADNAVKLVMDALNGRAYKDDVQVAVQGFKRTWADRARTAVVVEALHS